MAIIWTRGYRGPGTEYAYLPAGEYEVADADNWPRGKVRRELAHEMLAINLARVTEADASAYDDLSPAGGVFVESYEYPDDNAVLFDVDNASDEPPDPGAVLPGEVGAVLDQAGPTEAIFDSEPETPKRRGRSKRA